MARKANPDVKIKKLEGEIKKLQQKNTKLSSSLKEAVANGKEKLTQLKAKQEEQIKLIEQQAFEKAIKQIEKFHEEKEKIIATALTKFEKEWDKRNNQKTLKTRKVAQVKKVSTKKTAVAKKKESAVSSTNSDEAVAVEKAPAKKRGRPAKKAS